MKKKLRKAVLTKRTLYVLCFMALNLIELLRASQTGNIWYVAVNCMGLVVMVLVASAYPLKDFVTVSNGIYTIACAAAMVAVFIHWHRHVGEYYLWQIETAILNVWWIGILVKYLFKKVVIEKALRFRPSVLGWLWIAMSVLMIASVSQRLWPLWYLLMFGSFYLTQYKPEDQKALWDGMLNGTLISFFCIQIYAYGFRPYDVVRYTGAFANSNMAALYYLIVYLVCLCKLHILEQKKAHWGWKLFYLLGAGGMLSFQMYTLGRTAWVTSVALTVLYGFFVMKKIWKKKWRQILSRGVALVLAVVLTFLPVYYTIRWLPTILHHPVWYEGEYSVFRVHSFDPADSNKYISLESFLEAMLGRFLSMMKNQEALNPFVMRAHAAELEIEVVELVDVPWTDDGGIISRLTIYKAYWNDLTWYGNGPTKGYYWIGDRRYHSWHAQNLWLQIAYYYGIPAGILLIVITFVMLYCHGKRLFTDRQNPYAIIPFFVCVLFAMYGLTEVVWNPGQLVMFLIFFVQHPQIYQKNAVAISIET